MTGPSAKKAQRGVAILIVLVSLALMMAVVSELSSREIVYYKLAINERDGLQAEALAQSGVNFAQIVLSLQEPLQGYLTNFAKMGVQMPNYTVWELLPVDSDLLNLFKGGFVPDFMGGDKGKDKDGDDKGQATDKGKDTEAKTAEKSEDKKGKDQEPEKEANVLGPGPYEAPEGGYGGFSGRFSTEIEDEERKISIRKWAKHESFPKRRLIADQIYRILTKPENAKLFDGTTGDTKNFTPSQLVGNIYDFISEEDQAVDVTASAQDWGRVLVGDKRAIYYDTPGITPNKAPLNSLSDLRLIPGMTDAIFNLLSKYLTIYGEGDKINLLTASDEVLTSIFSMCAKNPEAGLLQQQGFVQELLASWKKKKNDGQYNPTSEGIVAHLEENRIEVDKQECSKSVGTESKNFTVKSTATVGTVTKTLLVRLRSAGSITTIYQYQYL